MLPNPSLVKWGLFVNEPECGRKIQDRDYRVNNAAHQPKAVLQYILSHLGCLRWCFFVLIVILYSGRLASQTATDEQTQGKPLRFDLTPLVGYRTSMTFPTGQDGQEPSPHVILDANPSYGMAVGVRLDEENLIEFRWARQDTHVHLEDSGPSSNVRVVLDQFHGDFTHEFILEEWPPWARPFVMGSIGATHIGGGTSSSFTRFSFGLGGGVKVHFTRHLGLRMQGEWLPLAVDPEVRSFICGGGCIVHLSATLVSQGEITVGPVLRF
jgi:hypothetical protein